MQETNNILLSVRQLRTWFELRKWGFFRYGSVRAVDGVSFEMKKGEAVAIVGESGCGKSTLARTILRIYSPIAGSIIFQGENIAGFSGGALKKYRSKVGFVQQDPYGALPPFMNIRRILEEPLLIHGVKNRRRRLDTIREVLAEQNLAAADDILQKFPHMLSGGQQQRVVIARACILDPELIVADEPVSMLDASVRISILQQLRKVQQTHGVGLLYVTHDLSTVRYFSDRIMVMYAGRIIEQAPVAKLLAGPLHPYTRALLEAIPDPDAGNAKTLREVPEGEPPSLAAPPPGCRFHPRCKARIAGLCECEPPPGFEPQSGHRVECWLYDRTPEMKPSGGVENGQ